MAAICVTFLNEDVRYFGRHSHDLRTHHTSYENFSKLWQRTLECTTLCCLRKQEAVTGALGCILGASPMDLSKNDLDICKNPWFPTLILVFLPPSNYKDQTQTAFADKDDFHSLTRRQCRRFPSDVTSAHVRKVPRRTRFAFRAS